MTTCLFVHDHRFLSDGSSYYSDKLPYSVWLRYLLHFSKVTVFARSSSALLDKDNTPISSGPGVVFEVASYGGSKFSFFRAISRQDTKLRKLIASHDVLVIRLPSELGLMAARIALQLKKPYVVEVVGCAWASLWYYGTYLAKAYAPVQFLRMRRAVRRAAFASYVTQNFLQRRYPSATGSQTVAISNVELAAPDPAVGLSRLGRITKREGPFVLGLVGSFTAKHKGVHIAIEALALATAFPDCQLRILGSGKPALYQDIAQRLGVGDRVFFDGVRSSGAGVFEWLDGVDLYLQPSLTEGVPRALIEAMSRGCPSLASAVGGIPELLPAASLVPPGDAKYLARSLMRYIPNREWQGEQALANIAKAKLYTKDKLDSRRASFFASVCTSLSEESGRSLRG